MRPSMTRLSGWGVATIRVFKDDEPAVAAPAAAALHAAWPQQHGAWSGTDPWLTWRSRTERIALASSPDRLKKLLTELQPGNSEAGCAIDLSEAVGVWRLEGAALPGVLARLADVSALPAPGNATRLRWADVAAVLFRISEFDALLLADATLEPYLADWWAYACDAL